MSNPGLHIAMKHRLLEDAVHSPAAQAIRKVLETMISERICTIEEFITLLDLDRRDDWPTIANELAERMVPVIISRVHRVEDFMPWKICREYRTELSGVVSERVWRSSNAAISTIMHRVNELLEP